MGKHRKPKDNTTVQRAATLGAAAVSLPTLALTFTPDAQAASETTLSNMPRAAITKAATDAPPPVTPPKQCDDYIVKGGDTFGGIAHSFKVPLGVLKPLNPGVIAGSRPDNYSVLYAGGHIHLPDGSCVPTSPPPPPPAPAPAPSPTGHHHQWRHHQHWHHHHWRPQPIPAPVPDPSGPPPIVVGGSTVPAIAPDCPGTSSGYCSHSPSYWAPLIRQAMGLVGGRVAANQDVAGVERLITSESSGDPNSINLSDSNAQQGTPSKGLMQVIQPTFDAYHVSGTSQNLYDPLANIAAALNYINHQYGGSIPSSPY